MRLLKGSAIFLGGSFKNLLIFFCFIISLGIEAFGRLPEQDPTREWLGTEYADTLINYIRKTHSKMELTIDLKDVVEFDLERLRDNRTLGERLKEAYLAFRDPSVKEQGLHFKFIHAFQSLMNHDFGSFIMRLEHGEPFVIGGKKSVSGPDSALVDWIASRPDRSIYPHQLMTQALKVYNGRVIAAWMLVWNILRDGWQATPTRNYDILSSKFAPLTGEYHLWRGGVNYIMIPYGQWHMAEATVSTPGKPDEKVNSRVTMRMVVSKRGDEFSYLYHRVGVELFALVTSKIYGSSFLGKLAGKTGALGEWLKFTQTSGLTSENKKRVRNDLIAAESGSRIFDIVEKGVQPEIDIKTPISAGLYIKSNPEIYDRKYQLPSDRPAVYYGTKINEKFWAPTMSLEELQYRFYHATRYDKEVLNPVILAATGEYDRLHRGLSDYLESGAQDKVLNTYITNYLGGMRGTPKKSDMRNEDTNLSAELNIGNAMMVDEKYDFEEIPRRIDVLLTRIIVASQQLSFYRPVQKSADNGGFKCRQLFL